MIADPLIDWWRRRGWSQPRFTKARQFERMSSVPELPPRRMIAVVGTSNHPKWLVFVCPCGRAHRIALNTSPQRKPQWRFEIDDSGAVSIYPSVDALTHDRRCHFWVKHGKVEWARD